MQNIFSVFQIFQESNIMDKLFTLAITIFQLFITRKEKSDFKCSLWNIPSVSCSVTA